ncbi:MAG: CFI-box-CTERM domain-containing protein [Candidatus Woesearchaeota archaeon]|jgi:hypothetical protein
MEYNKESGEPKVGDITYMNGKTYECIENQDIEGRAWGTKWIEKDKECFVATVVYGNINAPEVQILREFRDEVLVKNYLGRKFVSFYYGGTGEKTANFIRKHVPYLIPTIKKGLDFIVQKYQLKE